MTISEKIVIIAGVVLISLITSYSTDVLFPGSLIFMKEFDALLIYLFL